MLAVPPALLDILELAPGSDVGLAADNGRLKVEPVQSGDDRVLDLDAGEAASLPPEIRDDVMARLATIVEVA